MDYKCIFCKDTGSFGGGDGREFSCYCVTERENGCKQNHDPALFESEIALNA